MRVRSWGLVRKGLEEGRSRILEGREDESSACASSTTSSCYARSHLPNNGKHQLRGKVKLALRMLMCSLGQERSVAPYHLPS
jgi:hypothetical protein